MGFRAYRFALAAAFLVAPPSVLAYSTGIAGYSNNPSAAHGSGSNCTSCHTGALGNYTGYTTLINGVSSGTTVIQGVNTNASITVSTSHTGGNAVRAGLNASTNTGTLTAGSGTRITTAGVDGIDGELTHSTPQTLSGAFNPSWTFTFNPGGSSAAVTLYVCVNPVDGDAAGFDDGDGPADCRTHTFDVNSQPVIGNVVNQSIQENGTTGALSFSVSDTETAAASLTVTRSSSNTTVVPLANVVLGGSGGTRTVTVTPAANQFGSSTITLNLSDGSGGTDSDTFVVTVNDQPTVSNIADQSTAEDTPIGPLAFTVADGETAAGSLTMSGSSSNTTLVPNANIAFGGSGANRTVTITPAANQSGSTTITVTASDPSGGSGSDTFLLTVTSDNDQPTISAVANQTISEDGATSALAFTVGDTESAATLLTMSGASSNQTLVPDANIVFGGSGASRNVTVMPAANQFGTATITLTVSDPDGGSAQEPFTLTVNAVNDAPVLADVPDASTADFVLFSHQTSVTDADPADSASYDLSGEPAWLGISSGGLISGTPPIGTTGTFNITVTVTDGAGAPDSDPFMLTVTAPDADGDQMPDSWENLHGLDPNVDDADQDADGDGLTNLEEYQQGLDPNLDDVDPVVTAPADLVIPSTGYLTVVDIGSATATDGLDGALTAVADLGNTALRPGRYTVTWTATDAAGNGDSDTQQIDVLPLVELQGLPAVAGEGGPAAVLAVLNGDAPEYPVTIDYTVGGTAGPGDSDAAAGTITINGGTTGFYLFAITDDGVPEATETVVITATGATQAALGSNAAVTIPIGDGNVAPQIFSLDGNQNGSPRFTAYTGDGPFVIFTNAFDGNNDALTYDWSGSDDALGIDADGTDTPTFDPSGLAPGAYTARLQVSDGNGGVATAQVLLLVASGTSADSDLDSDGVPDSVDSVTDYQAVLPDQTGDLANEALLETDAQHSLRRGRTSLAAGRTGALVSMSDIVAFGVGGGGIALGADSYDNVGGIFDFEIHGLNPGDTARIVLPLQTSIREGAVYRKFDPVAGWHDFVIDADNAVASAHSTLGQCPGPNSGEYVDGLQPFAECVRLTLEDGGPNDADGAADGVIRDPGGVALTVSESGATVRVSSGPFLALMLPLAALLRLRRRAGVALLAVVAALAALPARAEHHIRIHYTGDVASGFDDNVTNAQHDADIRESGFVSANGNVDYQLALSLYTTLLLRGSAQYEYWNSFDGLNNVKGTAMARLLYRGDGDFFTPTFAGWVSVAGLEYDSAIRDGIEYRAGAFITENLTTQVTGRFALMANHREAAGEVFDLDGVSASLNLDWVPAPRMTVYTGYQFYDGGVASTAAPTVWIVNAAEAIEADDAFGGLAGGLRAYRLDAQAGIVTLGYNYAFSRKLSADLQGQFISTRADARNEYERTVGVVSLLARF